MSKLFAPIIDSRLPTALKEGTNSYKITIPFQLSLGVSIEDIDDIVAKFKKVGTGNSPSDPVSASNISKEDLTATFDLPEDFQTVEEFYKVQIAFKNNTDGVGYYSNVGVFKLIVPPEFTCKPVFDTNTGLIKLNINVSFETDSSETVTKYYINSKELIPKEIENGYFLSTLASRDINRVRFITSNNYTASYLFIISLNIEEDLTLADGICMPDQRQGCVKIIHPSDDMYLLKRYNNSFHFLGSDSLIIDPFIEQGQEYFYYGVYAPSESPQTDAETGLDNYVFTFKDSSYQSISLDFEDMLIFDKNNGEIRQLSLSYNPKVSSYKTNVLETKTNTLGGRYPFIFRNGDVNYKEFQISGLLSVLLDNNGDFIEQETTDELTRQKTAAGADEEIVIAGSRTDLTADNIYQERLFKTAVYDWFTNGKPKLLRTPTEGNFIVRFMNVSMTPNDQLGRMLHTINATAVEIDECSNENLKKYGLM